MKLEDIKELCDKYSVKLSFEMPEGYEDAFGTYDVTVNTLFLNLSLTTDKEYIRDYYFYHELRHAYQYTHRSEFSSEIQSSLDYVILFNGVCYKLEGNEWREYRMEGSDDFFTQAYLSLPYELDANKWAYDQCTQRYPEKQNELNELYRSWLPSAKMTPSELKDLFQRIDMNS